MKRKNEFIFGNTKLLKMLKRTYHSHKFGISLPFITGYEERGKKVEDFNDLQKIFNKRIINTLLSFAENESFKSNEIFCEFIYPVRILKAPCPYILTNKRIIISSKNDFSDEYFQIELDRVKLFNLKPSESETKIILILNENNAITSGGASLKQKDFINKFILDSDNITSQVDALIDKTQGKFETQPFNDESLMLLDTLPKRMPFINNVFRLLRMFSLLLFGFGGMGIVTLFFQNHNETESTLGQFSTHIFIAVIYAIGGIIYFIADFFLLKKAPIGNLVHALYEKMQLNEINKVYRIAQSIINKTEGEGFKETSYLMARMIALLALSGRKKEDKKTTIELASQTILLCETLINQGIKTPLVYFCLATSAEIVNKIEIAIQAYKEYLDLHPLDEQTMAEFKLLTSE